MLLPPALVCSNPQHDPIGCRVTRLETEGEQLHGLAVETTLWLLGVRMFGESGE